MEKLYAPSTVKALRERHDLRPSKSLGQNFLIDGNVVERIVEAAGIGGEDLVLEVGPGLGALTAAAAERAFRVVAVEIDRRLMPPLREALAGLGNVRLVNEDILKADLRGILEQNMGGECQRTVRIIGNLPYYITSAVVMRFLKEELPADSMTFMMQKEVAERIRAGVGTRACGAITAAVRYYCDVRLIMNVPGSAFVPRPKVDSSVLRLDIRKEKAVAPLSEALFFSVIRAGFGQRRKTLLNSLSGMDGLSREEAGQALAAAGVDPVRRAETLDLAEFAAVADAIWRIQNGG
jgi:16S rRNA (adenine1518-N6/adenine1519-N6)-dimethyltransferase